MTMTTERDSFLSSNGSDKIACYYWHDNTIPRAVVQLSHGMCEYADRYAPFIEYLCTAGFAVCANDHLGHGASVSNDDRLGYFAAKNGWHCLVEDLAVMTKHAKKRWEDTPIFMFGHSMGSFVARAYMTKYGGLLNGVILSGTGNNSAAGAAVPIAKAVRAIKGDTYRSKLLTSLAFGGYNKRITPPRTGSDWLTRNEAIVDKYIKDPKCSFMFTTSAYCDLLSMLSFVSSSSWAKKASHALPVLLISGDMDPVGDYGRAARIVAERLRAAGAADVSEKSYHGARHELTNELCSDEVYADVRAWIDERL